jgi:broad specificity phosphatase PhoE
MILIRHGQSEFNLRFSRTGIDPGIEDAPLTSLGQAQAEEAAQTLAGARVTRIIASPYTRALQTAAPFARRFNLPVTISPLVRERYAYSCDVGSTVAHLRGAWPQHDFAHLPDIWWPAETESERAALARAAQFHVEMAMRPDHAETLVVSHWGFILAMTGRSVANCEWVVVEPDADFVAAADLV